MAGAQSVVVSCQAYNPINYLRNVAVNNSRTAYTFYVDVDLVPSPTLYDSLCRRVADLERSGSRNVVTIAFHSIVSPVPRCLLLLL